MGDFENIPQIKPNVAGTFLDDQNKVTESASILPKEEVEEIFIPNLSKNEDKTSDKKAGSPRFGETGRKGKNKKWKFLFIALAIFVFFVTALGLITFNIYKKGLALKDSTIRLADAGKAQDLGKIKIELADTKVKLDEFDKSYQNISWTKFIPYLGIFVRDGQHFIKAGKEGLGAGDLVIKAIEPYADIIGFTGGSQANSGQETAQDRINFIIKSIPELTPQADKIAKKMEVIKAGLDQIDASRYPEKIFGKDIRVRLEEGLALSDEITLLVINGKPLLENANFLLGVDKPRNYLIIFQNDKELRPTGGFITAYTIAKVQNGKFEPVLSSDIYNLDSKYTPSVPAPDPIINYLKGPYVANRKLRLRDMNWSPDFSESMKLFTEEAKKVGVKNIDGVIAVDTQLLVYLLNVLGEIGVSGYGNFSTKIVADCNCPQVIFELESFADIEGPIVWSENEPGKIVYAPANYDNRKKIIGPLMNSVLANTLGQPKEKLPALFEAILKSITEKHVVFYLLDDKSQKAVEQFGIAGRIENFDGDYLHINDANLGGRKSNLYVTQEVTQEIEIKKDGSVEKTLTVLYKNPEKYDGWLNSVLPNWVRVYVPKGSELMDFEGVEEKEEPYEDLGKEVFAGFFKLRPEGVSKVVFKYKLPFKISGNEYKILIQKQPGTNTPLYTLKIGKREEEFFLATDKEMNLRFK